MKLINSETVIGQLVLDFEGQITMQDPFIMEYRIDLKGYRTMLLHRYDTFSFNNRIVIPKSMIVTSYEADEDLTEYYYYSLDHSIKYRDEAMSHDIQRASEYMQSLLDNSNKPPEQSKEDILPDVPKSSNTVH